MFVNQQAAFFIERLIYYGEEIKPSHTITGSRIILFNDSMVESDTRTGSIQRQRLYD